MLHLLPVDVEVATLQPWMPTVCTVCQLLAIACLSPVPAGAVEELDTL